MVPLCESVYMLCIPFHFDFNPVLQKPLKYMKRGSRLCLVCACKYLCACVHQYVSFCFPNIIYMASASIIALLLKMICGGGSFSYRSKCSKFKIYSSTLRC